MASSTRPASGTPTSGRRESPTKGVRADRASSTPSRRRRPRPPSHLTLTSRALLRRQAQPPLGGRQGPGAPPARLATHPARPPVRSPVRSPVRPPARPPAPAPPPTWQLWGSMHGNAALNLFHLGRGRPRPNASMMGWTCRPLEWAHRLCGCDFELPTVGAAAFLYAGMRRVVRRVGRGPGDGARPEGRMPRPHPASRDP